MRDEDTDAGEVSRTLQGRPKVFSPRDLLRESKKLARRGETPGEVPPYWRPQTRADCESAARPCPFVACRHHLFLDVHPGTGSLKINAIDADIEGMVDTCSLDAAERGGMTLEEISAVFNITRERIRQIEALAVGRLKYNSSAQEAKDIGYYAKPELE